METPAKYLLEEGADNCPEGHESREDKRSDDDSEGSFTVIEEKEVANMDISPEEDSEKLSFPLSDSRFSSKSCTEEFGISEVKPNRPADKVRNHDEYDLAYSSLELSKGHTHIPGEGFVETLSWDEFLEYRRVAQKLKGENDEDLERTPKGASENFPLSARASPGRPLSGSHRSPEPFPRSIIVLTVLVLLLGAVLSQLPVKKADWYILERTSSKLSLDQLMNCVLADSVDDKVWGTHAKAYSVANMYGRSSKLVRMVRRTSSVLQSGITVNNVWMALAMAESTGDSALRMSAEEFLSGHADETLRSEAWKEEVMLNISKVLEKYKIAMYKELIKRIDRS